MHYYNLKECPCIIRSSESIDEFLQSQVMENQSQTVCIITILKSVDAFSLSQMKKKQPQPVSMLYQNLKSQSQRVLMHNHIIKS